MLRITQPALWTLLALCAAPPLHGAETPAPKPPAQTSASLQEQIESLAAVIRKTGASVGVSVLDARTGKALAAINDGDLFAPASNQKLLTSAFAIASLGGDYRFATGVFRTDDDIAVYGTFDPTLGDRRIAEQNGADPEAALDAWADKIKAAFGHKPVRDILLCGRLAPKDYRHADWPAAQRANWYAAPVSELNYNNNCLDVELRADKQGITPVVSPPSAFIRLVNSLRPGGQQWHVQASTNLDTVTVLGTAKSATSEPFNVAVDNPPMLLGRVLADRLARRGVRVSGTIRQVSVSDMNWVSAVPVAACTTPLGTVMARANKRSLNMAAECMFLRAGDGTWEGSARLAAAALQKTWGLPQGSFVIRDGSGLSSRDRVSPAAMTSLLRAMSQHKCAKMFADSLPVAGVDGTMSKRLDEDAYRGRVLGKTGYIGGVSALSGYVLDDRGRAALCFSVLVNQVKALDEAKALEDNIARRLVACVDQTRRE